MTAAAVILAGASLAANVTAFLQRTPSPFFDHQPARFWQDSHIAQGLYLFGEFPVSANEVLKRRTESGIQFFEKHAHLVRTTSEAGVPPWRFWEVVRENRYRRPAARAFVDRFDDSGRPLLLGLGYKAIGGISPFLIFWLGPLVAWPLLAWIATAFTLAGRPLAGVVFVLALGLMPFLAEALALSYSATGFHVLAALVSVPLAVYALFAPAIEDARWLIRVALAGLFLCICLLARGGAALTLLGPLTAIVVAATRVGHVRGRKPALRLALLSVAVLAAPYAAARVAVDHTVARTAASYGQGSVTPQRHAFWFGIWTGLGDHDREKGYQWLDWAASSAVVAAGGTALRSDRYDPANEAILRRLIVSDIESDPLWYVRILAHRAWGTVALVKLWPWAPLSGHSIAPSTHPNEGVIDSYYGLVTAADRSGIGHSRFEWPIPALVTPALVLLAFGLTRFRARLGRREPALLLILAAAVLPLPVLVGTGGAIEPQAFALVYALGWALLLDLLWGRRLFGPPSRSPMV